ncbi:MAG: hypothetical protein KDN20_10910 [Verrucomicrobiae bacterium]|nr:hypothetical protein [Verrucomicrobiae bacterium]
MQIEIFTLCDAATLDRGKLNLLGTFDSLRHRRYPQEMRSFAIVAQLRFSAEEGGHHEVEVRWFDADGQEVDRTETHPTKLALEERRDVSQHIWPVFGKTAFGPAEYMLQLVVDDCPVASIPLFLRE